MIHYGFDEAHGNFQAHNYTSEGIGGDYVNAEAQDANTIECNNANFLTPEDGSNPRMQMYLGCNHSPKMDGDLDNHVILHEYGHGISTRMTGGPGNVFCLTNFEQMGEGWSDWYGLMLTQDETSADFGRDEPIGIGVFLMHDALPGGFRPTPYSTDFAVNPTTYGDIGGLAVPHGVGYAWATILWEVTWDLIDAYGFEQDITNVDALAGNTIMMNLVTEGLNLQPCSPGFVDGRDAILAAVDVVYGGQTEAWRHDLKRLMWEGFARRGLGYFADQGSSMSTTDGTEDFAVPSEIAPDPIIDLAVMPDGDFVTLTWTAPDDEDSDVFGYDIRYASSEILTEDDWNNATSVPQGMVPQAPGSPEEFVVVDLNFETTYYFSIRSTDGPNRSDLSNSAEGTTLAPPVATVPTDPIEVTVPAEGADTYEYTIGNLGPSMLSYVLGFEETTPAVVDSRQSIPRPEVSERDDEPERDGEEHPAPTGEVQLMNEGGPDEFGYRWIDSNEPNGPTYDWIDITETGTELDLGLDDYAIVDLPFAFPYYEIAYNWVAIQSKASLAFGDAFIGYVNEPIPSEEEPHAIIAAYWDDLNPSSTTGGGAIYYDTLDDGRFVVTWEEVPFYLSDTEYATVQIILEPGGTIVMQYKEIVADNNANSATIGIENLDGTDGLEVVYNAPYVENELAIRFSMLWVESDISSGQVAAGNNETLTLSFDASDLEPGTYTADMTVTTNEVGDPALRGGAGDGLQEYVIPVTLTVEGIDTEDDDLAFEGTHRLSAVAPNPVNGLAQATLEVAEVQDVRVELFDVRGRKVATPFEGALAARIAQEIVLDGSDLAPGVYVLRISGEDFSEARQITVVR